MTFIRRRSPRNKYSNNRKARDFSGRTFDSNLERGVFAHLLLLERAGEIRELQHHGFTVYLTEAEIGYRADYRWINAKTDLMEYGEAKGFETYDWQIKVKLWAKYGPGPLTIWRGTEKNFRIDKVIHPSGLRLRCAECGAIVKEEQA